MADDHQIVLQGILALLNPHDEIMCVGTAENTDELLPLIESQAPDALLLDLSMPGKPALQLIETCRRMFPRLRVIVLTMHATALTVSQALKAGAHGFIAKDDPIESLLDTLWRVANGENGVITEHLQDAHQVAPHLTARELEVLQGIAKGLSTKEICANIHLSEKTVELYRTRLLKKFGLSKATELVRAAIHAGVLAMTTRQPKTAHGQNTKA